MSSAAAFEARHALPESRAAPTTLRQTIRASPDTCVNARAVASCASSNRLPAVSRMMPARCTAAPQPAAASDNARASV